MKTIDRDRLREWIVLGLMLACCLPLMAFGLIRPDGLLVLAGALVGLLAVVWLV